MIAEHGMGKTGLAKPCDHIDDAHAVRTAIDEIADEHQRSRRGARVGIDAEPAEESEQRLELSVHVTDDVERALREPLNQTRHATKDNGSSGRARRGMR